MKLVIIGHGMVGHKLLECLAQARDEGGANLQVTVLCEEPRPAYDRVHLSEFFAGKSADDLSLVEPGFFDETGFALRLNARATAIDRAARTVTVSTGETLHYDKLVLATGSYPFVPPVPGRDRADCRAGQHGLGRRMVQPLLRHSLDLCAGIRNKIVVLMLRFFVIHH